MTSRYWATQPDGHVPGYGGLRAANLTRTATSAEIGLHENGLRRTVDGAADAQARVSGWWCTGGCRLREHTTDNEPDV